MHYRFKKKEKEKKTGQRMPWAGITGPSTPSPPYVTLIAPDIVTKFPGRLGQGTGPRVDTIKLWSTLKFPTTQRIASNLPSSRNTSL